MGGRDFTISVKPWLSVLGVKSAKATAVHEPSGSFTDLVSGSVVLDDMVLLSASTSIASQLCETRFLRPLIHEKTHHATFNSPVGQALAALAASCANMPFETMTGQETASLPIRDLTVLRAFYGLIEPLVEGLALFAEHDCVPRDSEVASSVSTEAARLLVSDPRVRQALDPDGQFANPHVLLGFLLRMLRASEEWIDDKAFLLEQPAEDPPYYLLG